MHPVFEAWNPKEVRIGSLTIGGEHPVRVQSMTNTLTIDTDAVVAQCIRMIEAGCELIRITAQDTQEAENLAVIKNGLRKAGHSTPLIADVHFKPAVAELAARLVEKVRINPGNYADKRIGKAIRTQKAYEEELERIAGRLQPLLKICKQYGTAIRIGTNHGSLSGRIMKRYGDTPEGMAESAMEFVRICNASGFHNLVLSMKSSNVRVMVAATRLLVCKMVQENMQYPIHLGVTEAGNGPEGRIKSATGIGCLLADGIGDTIRVSLTEAPENEIPVAKQIVSHYLKPAAMSMDHIAIETSCNTAYFDYKRRISKPAGNIGLGNVPVVLHGARKIYSLDESLIEEGNYGAWNDLTGNETEAGYIRYIRYKPGNNLPVSELLSENTVLVFEVSGPGETNLIKKRIKELDDNGLHVPVVLHYIGKEAVLSRFATEASLCLGPLLADGLCDGVFIENPHMAAAEVNNIAFMILQASRARITQTEYIACPGCGRTQYNLEEALEKVRAATSHLKGLKIAVMGCNVNGPGEMADADYGYVGQGRGKVSLYCAKKQVKKNVPEQDAVNELISLMKTQGDWKSP